MLTLLDLVPPFTPGQRIRWTPAAVARGFTARRTYTVTTIDQAAGRWTVEAAGPKNGQSLRTVWPIGTPPRIEAA